MAPRDIRDLPAWRRLEAHRDELAETHLREVFDADPERGRRFSLEAAGLYLDYAKNPIVDTTIERLVELAEARGLPDAIEALFAGEAVNTTEARPALHMALRGGVDESLTVGGARVMDEVRAAHARLAEVCERLRSGAWRGADGRAIRHVVSVGIGGSELGPELVVDALGGADADAPEVRFLANVDGHAAASVLAGLEPARTLFVIVSKSFGTLETRTNAATALDWLEAGGVSRDAALERQVVAVSANAEAVAAFGVPAEHHLPLWDWVGGRYSVWSAVALPAAVRIGMARFERLLEGARAMDEHFRSAPLSRNMPALLGLIGIWNANFRDMPSRAVLPYDGRLRRLPAYLQQLEMESNGKGVQHDGSPVEWRTSPVVWGDVGTNGQHAFFQLLHQGRHRVPADFVACVTPDHDLADHHRQLLANCLAQSEALMRGRGIDEVRAELAARGLDDAEIERLAPHQVFEGDRPSNTILLERLDPERLGALIALYEHRVYVQAVIWGINPFDQWGVELGKRLAGVLADELAGAEPGEHDSSTDALRRRCLQRSGGD